MERSRQPVGHHSTYGQACVHCYKAKCRCIPTSRGDSCERCQRLRKECLPSNFSRRRNGGRAEASDQRIAQLEGRIEVMISAMQAMAGSTGTSAEAAEALRMLSGEAGVVSTFSSDEVTAGSVGTNGSIGGVVTPSTDPAPSAQIDTDFSLLSPSDLLSPQAEQSLQFFLTLMLPYFPFIALPPTTTALHLHETHPILLQSILTITTFSTRHRLSLLKSFKRVLFTSALMEVQSNIDLLLGLLTYLAWSSDAFLGRADLVSRLMVLAMSVVYDMRLFKPLEPDTRLMVLMTQGREDGDEENGGSVVGFLERQRAVLACFVLSDNISSHLGRIDALRWTPQMEEALRIIETNKSCPSDEAFAFQVRLQLLKQRASHVREQNEAGTAAATTSVPGLIYLKALRGELQGLMASFPSDLVQRGAFITHAHYVDLYITHLTYTISPNSPPLSLSSPPGFARLTCLWGSVEAIASWLANFHTLAPADLVGLPFHFWSQMMLCVVVLKYLSVLEDSGWDRGEVRRAVDLVAVIEWMVRKLDRVAVEAGLEQCEDSLFALLSRMLEKCKVWAAVRLDRAGDCLMRSVEETGLGQGGSRGEGQSSGGGSIPDFEQMMWMREMDLGNDQWLEEALGLSGPLVF